MDEITRKDIKKQIGQKDEDMIVKVHLLANGMVKVHGYKKDKAISLAYKTALEWFSNGGKYPVKR